MNNEHEREQEQEKLRAQWLRAFVHRWGDEMSDAAQSEMLRKADKLDPPVKEWRAKWPEHKGCLFVAHDNTPWPITYKGNVGRKLYTGVHKLNMIPHDGGECPVHKKQSVVVQFRGGGNSASSAAAYQWSHRDYGIDIIYYCPVDPVRVDV